MTVEGHVKLRNYVILGLLGLVLFLVFKSSPEPKEDSKILVLEKENERLKGLYNEQKQIAIISIQKTDSIKALKPKVITKYKTVYKSIESMGATISIEKRDSTLLVNGIDKTDTVQVAKFILTTTNKVNELTELDSLNKSIISQQDTTIKSQIEAIAKADKIQYNDDKIKKQLRKQIFKEKVKTRLVAIGGVVLVAVSILAL